METKDKFTTQYTFTILFAQLSIIITRDHPNICLNNGFGIPTLIMIYCIVFPTKESALYKVFHRITSSMFLTKTMKATCRQQHVKEMPYNKANNQSSLSGK